MSQLVALNFVKSLRRVFHEYSQIHCPTIAVLDGACLGGGLELAMSNDIRIATEQATIGLPETSLAIIPGAGGTQTLSRLVGPAITKELIFTADKITAHRALQLGIVNHVEKDFESAHHKALEMAKKISENGPIGVRMAKIAINRGVEVDKDTGLKIEELCYSQILNTEDRLEGLKAFAEKRKPAYKGK